jgi:hypothetical protein
MDRESDMIWLTACEPTGGNLVVTDGAFPVITPLLHAAARSHKEF